MMPVMAVGLLRTLMHGMREDGREGIILQLRSLPPHRWRDRERGGRASRWAGRYLFKMNPFYAGIFAENKGCVCSF